MTRPRGHLLYGRAVLHKRHGKKIILSQVSTTKFSDTYHIDVVEYEINGRLVSIFEPWVLLVPRIRLNVFMKC
jgi:hypothetical protein